MKHVWKVEIYPNCARVKPFYPWNQGERKNDSSQTDENGMLRLPFAFWELALESARIRQAKGMPRVVVKALISRSVYKMLSSRTSCNFNIVAIKAYEQRSMIGRSGHGWWSYLIYSSGAPSFRWPVPNYDLEMERTGWMECRGPNDI